jgi:hypothetical protein
MVRLNLWVDREIGALWWCMEGFYLWMMGGWGGGVIGGGWN